MMLIVFLLLIGASNATWNFIPHRGGFQTEA
jgi:hypothetical protein